MTDREAREPSLWELADLVTPMALRVAATLRVADHIADGRTTAAAIAMATRSDPKALGQLLGHLVALGVVSRGAAGEHRLTDRGEALREPHPSGLRARLDLECAVGRADLALVHLLESVRSGRAAYPLLFGQPFWDDLAADPTRTRSYDAQMGADVARWAKDLVPALDWSALGDLVDVGGGNGTLLAALLRAHPTLRGTVLDQPDTAEAARATLRNAGVADRSDVVAGSFFDPLPVGAGGYLLCAILHDWNDEDAATLLRRCAEAAGPRGRVFVVEKNGPDGESPSSHQDLRMLAYFGGRERGVADLQALAAEAGLRCMAVHRAGELSVMELAASSARRA